MELNIYLRFDGQCEEAFAFYARICGGGIAELERYGGSPAADQVPPEWKDKVLHARLNIGNDVILGADAPPGHYQKPDGFSVTFTLDTPEKAERVFAALAENGSVVVPLAPSFFATRFGMVTDRFATPWIVLCQPTD